MEPEDNAMETGRPLPPDIEWQVLKQVLLDPLTLYATALGIGCVVFGWLILSVLPFFASIVVMLGVVSGGIGTITGLVNYFFRHESMVGECLRQFACAADEQRRKEIHALRDKLAADGDPRTEKLLGDLLALVSILQGARQWKIDSFSQFEIARKVNILFEEGIRNLEQTFSLWSTAESFGDGPVRDALVQQREERIVELAENVNQLGRVLSSLQELRSSDHAQQLAEIVQELDTTLEVARRVQERMRNLDSSGKVSDQSI